MQGGAEVCQAPKNILVDLVRTLPKSFFKLVSPVWEDSSPDTPGLPRQDGGFDECAEYNGATAAEMDLFSSSIQKSRCCWLTLI